jgi:hypothetical protein
MRNYMLLLVAISVSLAAPNRLGAQTIDSPYRFLSFKRDVGVYVAYIFADAGGWGLGAQPGPAIGLQGAMRISDPLNVSVNVSYFPTERNVMDPSTGESRPEKLGTTPFNLLMLSARLQFNLTGARTWHRLVPYLIGGAGIAIDVAGDVNCSIPNNPDPTCDLGPLERFNFGTSFMGQVGFGTAIVISRRIGARITFEDNIWRLTTPEGWFLGGINLLPFPPSKEWTNNWQLSFIATYWF